MRIVLGMSNELNSKAVETIISSAFTHSQIGALDTYHQDPTGAFQITREDGQHTFYYDESDAATPGWVYKDAERNTTLIDSAYDVADVMLDMLGAGADAAGDLCDEAAKVADTALVRLCERAQSDDHDVEAWAAAVSAVSEARAQG